MNAFIHAFLACLAMAIFDSNSTELLTRSLDMIDWFGQGYQYKAVEVLTI